MRTDEERSKHSNKNAEKVYSTLSASYLTFDCLHIIAISANTFNESTPVFHGVVRCLLLLVRLL